MPGQYHSGEAPADPGTGWLTLTASGGFWHLEPTEARATRVADPAMDSDAGKALGILISSAHDGALALLGIPGIKPGKVDTPDIKFKTEGPPRAGPPAFGTAHHAPCKAPLPAVAHTIGPS